MPIRPTVLPAFAVFAAAARHQNFAHAAEELHLTASAVSHHVRRLESTLGVTLFQRHARGVELTAQGRALADATNVALADLDAVSGSLLSHDKEIARVRVTTLHSLAYCWLIPRLSSFTAAHPNVQLDFETSTALVRFDDAGPDVGIRHGPGPWPGLTAHFLMDDALFPVASPKLAGVRQVMKAAHIPRLPLISDVGLQEARQLDTDADPRPARRAASSIIARPEIALKPVLLRSGKPPDGPSVCWGFLLPRPTDRISIDFASDSLEGTRADFEL